MAGIASNGTKLTSAPLSIDRSRFHSVLLFQITGTNECVIAIELKERCESEQEQVAMGKVMGCRRKLMITTAPYQASSNTSECRSSERQAGKTGVRPSPHPSCPIEPAKVPFHRHLFPFLSCSSSPIYPRFASLAICHKDGKSETRCLGKLGRQTCGSPCRGFVSSCFSLSSEGDPCVGRHVWSRLDAGPRLAHNRTSRQDETLVFKETVMKMPVTGSQTLFHRLN